MKIKSKKIDEGKKNVQHKMQTRREKRAKRVGARIFKPEGKEVNKGNQPWPLEPGVGL